MLWLLSTQLQVHGVAPWPVEVGPEFVHGNKSKFTEVVKDFGFNFTEKPWPDWWYFGRDGKLVNDDDGVDADIERVGLTTATHSLPSTCKLPCDHACNCLHIICDTNNCRLLPASVCRQRHAWHLLQVHDLFDCVGDETPPEPSSDMSAEQWLRSTGASEKMLAVAAVCYANDFGCSLRQLGLREMIIENQRWAFVLGCSAEACDLPPASTRVVCDLYNSATESVYRQYVFAGAH